MRVCLRYAIITLAFTAAFAINGVAQRATQTVNAGTLIDVRVDERIATSYSDGQVFSGTVENDVTGRSGRIGIPRGSEVELVIREIANDELVVDLDSVTINGSRYGIATQGSIRSNSRSGTNFGTRSLIGALVGIAGNQNGGFGLEDQVLARGREIDVPAGSVLTLRLTRSIQTPVVDSGFYRNGRHYHPGYGDDTASAAYQAGYEAGRSDADRNLRFNPNTSRWTRRADRLDFEAGYNQGYDSYYSSQSAQQRFKPATNARVTIGRDNLISWDAPSNVRVYVQVDNQQRQLFAEGKSGSQAAPWIQTGHVYVFTLEDMNGNELARDRMDLRERSRRSR